MLISVLLAMFSAPICAGIAARHAARKSWFRAAAWGVSAFVFAQCAVAGQVILWLR